jgi:hypothetical protein
MKDNHASKPNAAGMDRMLFMVKTISFRQQTCAAYSLFFKRETGELYTLQICGPFVSQGVGVLRVLYNSNKTLNVNRHSSRKTLANVFFRMKRVGAAIG